MLVGILKRILNAREELVKVLTWSLKAVVGNVACAGGSRPDVVITCARAVRVYCRGSPFRPFVSDRE